MAKCNTCGFYEPMNGEGLCKQDAPHLSPTVADQNGLWPVVDGEKEQCGKYEV